MNFVKEKPSTDKTTVDKAAVEKILRPVKFEQGFHFATDLGKYTGETAINLFSFYEELQTIDMQSVKFHFQRRDFQKWIETTLGDQELASRINKIPSELTDEELKKQILKTVAVRLAELQTIFNSSSKQTTAKVGVTTSVASVGELRKFTLEDVKQYNGQAGKPIYIIFGEKVYDVTDSSLWQEGNHMNTHHAGKDLTDKIKDLTAKKFSKK